jgi:PAS domain S-box-containing protein
MNSFNAIFKHAHIGIIILGKSGEIELLNPFVEEIFGYERDELIGQKIEVLILKSLESKHILYRDEYIKNPEPRSMGKGRDLHGVKKNGEVFPVEVSLCSYVIGEEVKLVSFVNDISIRKKSEAELVKLTSDLEKKVAERTSELSQALVELNHTNENLKKSELEVKKSLESEKQINEMKSRFVSMASHEFRTPLAGILSSVTLLEKYTQAEEQDKREKHTNRIKKSVNNLTSILTDFLSLDKLEEGIIKANPETFNLNQLLSEVITETREMTEGQTITYQNDLNEDLSLFNDSGMLRNVVINLLSNSLKYSSIKSVISVEVISEDEQIVLSITDTGIGIPAEEQQHLFDRFFRAGNAVNLEGTGLGLHIVKRYLDLMQGKISFVSVLDEGTTFTIKLPMEI